MNPFVYQANPARVVFGVGAFAQLPAEINRLGCRRALVLSTPNQVKLALEAAKLIGEAAAGLFNQAQMHVPAVVLGDRPAASASRRVTTCLTRKDGRPTLSGTIIPNR